MDARAAEVGSARRHLEAIARAPRPAGGAGEARARAYCADVLAGAGFAVTEETFFYSAFPGRVGTPLLGVTAAAILATAGHLGWDGRGGAALLVLLVGVQIAGTVGWWLGRHGILSLPWMRASGTNLTATRGSPSIWLVAHLDSKSQPVPILVRVLGVVGVLVTLMLAVTVAALQAGGRNVSWAWPWITVAGVLCSLPVAASVVGERSPGALDDASGVATVLTVAQTLPSHAAVGVVLTSAEELGLAGARAWVRGRRPARAVNVDGVDDAGDLRVTWTNRRPVELIDALVASAATAKTKVRVGRLVPGALLDAVAFADRRWDVVTLSRGTVRTVARIHTSGDSLEHLDGTGVALTASIIRAAVAAVA